MPRILSLPFSMMKALRRMGAPLPEGNRSHRENDLGVSSRGQQRGGVRESRQRLLYSTEDFCQQFRIFVLRDPFQLTKHTSLVTEKYRPAPPSRAPGIFPIRSDVFSSLPLRSRKTKILRSFFLLYLSLSGKLSL